MRDLIAENEEDTSAKVLCMSSSLRSGLSSLSVGGGGWGALVEVIIEPRIQGPLLSQRGSAHAGLEDKILSYRIAAGLMSLLDS